MEFIFKIKFVSLKYDVISFHTLNRQNCLYELFYLFLLRIYFFAGNNLIP